MSAGRLFVAKWGSDKATRLSVQRSSSMECCNTTSGIVLGLNWNTRAIHYCIIVRYEVVTNCYLRPSECEFFSGWASVFGRVASTCCCVWISASIHWHSCPITLIKSDKWPLLRQANTLQLQKTPISSQTWEFFHNVAIFNQSSASSWHCFRVYVTFPDKNISKRL